MGLVMPDKNIRKADQLKISTASSRDAYSELGGGEQGLTMHVAWPVSDHPAVHEGGGERPVSYTWGN